MGGGRWWRLQMRLLDPFKASQLLCCHKNVSRHFFLKEGVKKKTSHNKVVEAAYNAGKGEEGGGLPEPNQ